MSENMFDQYPHFAPRAFAPGLTVGDIMPNSCVGVDAECMEDVELPGAYGIRVAPEAEIEANLEAFRRMYGREDGVVYIIGGQTAKYGSEEGEIIIGRAKVFRGIG